MDKTIKISIKAYEVMVKRKEKYGLGIKQQVDDLVLKSGSGVSMVSIIDALDSANKDRLDKWRDDNIKGDK